MKFLGTCRKIIALLSVILLPTLAMQGTAKKRVVQKKVAAAKKMTIAKATQEQRNAAKKKQVIKQQKPAKLPTKPVMTITQKPLALSAQDLAQATAYATALGTAIQPSGQEQQFNRLILLLDPHNLELNGSAGPAITSDLIVGLHDQTAAIIVSRSLIIHYLKLAQCETADANKGYVALFFENNNWDKQWNKYYSQTGDLMLLIPKNAPLLSHAFKLNTLTKTTLTSSEYTKAQSSLALARNNENATFVTKKSLLARLQNYLQSLAPIDYVAPCKDNDNATFVIKKGLLARWHHYLQSLAPIDYVDPDDVINGIKNLLLPTAALSKKTTNNIPAWLVYSSGHGSLASPSPGSESATASAAHVLGMPFNNAIQLLTLFNNNLNQPAYANTAFFYIMTCYSGGYNQAFLNAALDRINPNYLVVTQGAPDKTTGNYMWLKVSAKNPTGTEPSTPQTVTPNISFTKFFDGVTAYLTYKPIAGGKAPTLGAAIEKMSGYKHLYSQPFVRIPNVGTFQAFSVNQDIKVLTKALVKSYALANQTTVIDFSNCGAVLVSAQWVYNPLRIPSNAALVSLLVPPVQQSNFANKIYSIQPASYKLEIAATAVPTHFFREIQLKPFYSFYPLMNIQNQTVSNTSKILFSRLEDFVRELMFHHGAYCKRYLIEQLNIITPDNVVSTTDEGMLNNILITACGSKTGDYSVKVSVIFCYQNKVYTLSVTAKDSRNYSAFGAFANPASYETSTSAATLNNQFNNQVTALQQALEKAGEPADIQPLDFIKGKTRAAASKAEAENQ